MSVELIITQGSNAGTAAPIHQGYYLVGRLKKCQIRPKSRSVSRRHCLLLHNEDGFGALDLKSTRGTYVNGTKLVPHQWRVLADGDELRFGKVVFKVSVKQPAFAGTATIAHPSDRGGDTNAAESEPPISWNNQDVAEFLKVEDQIDFDFGYGPGENEGNASQLDIDDDALDEEIADANVLAESAIHLGKPQDTFIGEVADEFDDEADGGKEIEVDSKPKKRPPRQNIDHKQYKRAPRRSFNLPSFSLRSDDGYDWKLLGTVTLVLVTLGLLGYQLYQFGSPTNVEIRQDLD
ncbi:FHA domain-containing protein [Rhodopirellula sp. JC639]|uniref:FHA domain-containing protein n=1 Tax=Stieleria mannarensis TaxID=2755585 RepID=UPI0016009245|nr:FHA domain-containing protein [Rhodopirellula sp. JC639]